MIPFTLKTLQFWGLFLKCFIVNFSLSASSFLTFLNSCVFRIPWISLLLLKKSSLFFIFFFFHLVYFLVRVSILYFGSSDEFFIFTIIFLIFRTLFVV